MVYMKNNIRKIVKAGYEKGNYLAQFRINKNPNKMELLFLKKFLSYLPERPDVLDLGCGPGIPLDTYLVAKGCNVTGIDISQKHIKMAKINVPTAKFINKDFSKIKLSKTFDGIISFYAIFHIPRVEHKNLFLKMNKLLNKDGVILVTLGAKGGGYIEEDEWMVGAKMAWDSYDHKTYKNMIIQSGFKILKTAFQGYEGADEYHYWVLAKKKGTSARKN